MRVDDTIPAALVGAVREREPDELDRLIEHRARQAEDDRRTEEAWEESARRHHERRRREIRAQWYAHFMDMADGHRRLSELHEARALTLLEEEL